MIYVVVPLLDVKLSPILLPLEIDLLEVEQVLIVLDVNLFDLLLEHLLLVVLDQLVPMMLHVSQLLRQLRFLQRVTLDVFLEFHNFTLDLPDDLSPLLVFIL